MAARPEGGSKEPPVECGGNIAEIEELSDSNSGHSGGGGSDVSIHCIIPAIRRRRRRALLAAADEVT
jgi:hypothetical protein